MIKHSVFLRRRLSVTVTAVCALVAILVAITTYAGALAWIYGPAAAVSSSGSSLTVQNASNAAFSHQKHKFHLLQHSLAHVSVENGHSRPQALVTSAHVRAILDKDKDKEDKSKGKDNQKAANKGQPGAADRRGPKGPRDSANVEDDEESSQSVPYPGFSDSASPSHSSSTSSRTPQSLSPGAAVSLPVAANAAENTIIVFTQPPGNPGNTATAPATPPGGPPQQPVVAAGPSQYNIVICPGDPRCPAQPPQTSNAPPNTGSSSSSSVTTSQSSTTSPSGSVSSQNIEVIDLRNGQGSTSQDGNASSYAEHSAAAGNNATTASNSTVVTTGNATLQGPPVVPDPPRSDEFVPDVIQKLEGPDKAETLTVRLLIRGNISQFTSNESFVIINTTATASGTPASRWTLTMQQQQQNSTNRKLLQQQQQQQQQPLLIVIMSVNTFSPQLVWYRLTRPEATAAAAASSSSSSSSPANAASIVPPGGCSTEYCARLQAAGVNVDTTSSNSTGSSSTSSIEVTPSFQNLLEPSSLSSVSLLPQGNSTAAPANSPEASSPASANNSSDLQRYLAAQLRADSQTTHRITQVIASIATALIGLFLIWLTWYKRRSILRCLGLGGQQQSDGNQSDSTEQLHGGLSKSSSAVTDRADGVTVQHVRHKVRVTGRKRPARAITMTATPAAAAALVTAADHEYRHQVGSFSDSIYSQTSNNGSAASSSVRDDSWWLAPDHQGANIDPSLRSSGTVMLAAAAAGGGSDLSSPVSLHHYTGVPAYSKYERSQSHDRDAISDQHYTQYNQPDRVHGGLSRQEADYLYSSDHQNHQFPGVYHSRATGSSDESAYQSSVRSADVRLPRWGSPMGRGLQGLDEEEHRVLAGYLAKLQSSGRF